ncbi:sphingomyelin phosphodiesterase 4-like isoform X2 [Limulus polyphemus]|uniref:Sphingomyelin phosphodiesterase 4-like isoform X2 n=1 Tax=Limulus polyphemus TaxID=6850 RepID=A0ABM1T0R1_LIMPO|nr:sphingomyelin phosphodiesterase 4-like isoform X2 [Limulus polyphemus]
MGWKGILQLYSILPHMVQKKLYKFFRLCFDRWPCDSSLSFPLEMWLSYIQPWKYISHRVGSLSVDSEKENRDGFVNVKWKKFISENLCFYTVIFQQLLPKFFQVDLSSPENASMLFHLAKVFSKPNLGTVISEVESNFCKAPVCLLSPSFSSVNTPPPLMHNASVCGSLRQQLMNLEGPGFDYKPFFGEYQTSQLEIPSVSLRGTSLQEKTPDTVPGPNGPCLTPLGRYQLVNRIHKFPFHYQENPDLQPIRNYEITFLVRLLHQISTAVNKNYGNKFNDFYYRETFLGQLARQLLTAPSIFYKITKTGSVPSSFRELQTLPPRVHLRYLARRQTVGYLLCLIILGYVCGYNPLKVVFFLAILTAFYFVIKAFFYPMPPPPPPSL